MGMFDWLTGAADTTRGLGSVAVGGAGMADTITGAPGYAGSPGAPRLLKDQNFLRGLGEAGAATSAGGTAGEVLGDFASTYGRRKATQRVGEDQLAKQQSLQQMVIEALKKDPTGSSILGDKDDPNTLNDIKITNDKIAFSSPNPGITKPGYPGEQSPIEMDKGVKFGGQDLPDFLKAGLA